MDVKIWGKINRVLVFIGPMMAVFVVTSVSIIYLFNSMQDANLAYAGLYYDGLSNQHILAGDLDKAMIASGVAWQFCELYRIEIRTMERRYLPLCDVIKDKHMFLAYCEQDPDGELCASHIAEEISSRYGDVGDLARELQDNPPYFGLVLSPGYRPMECHLGGEKVKCPV